MSKELHLWLKEPDCFYYPDFMSTSNAIGMNDECIHTTQPHFLQFRYGYRLFVHTDRHDLVGHEITLGDCVGTERIIREAHNLEKMLIAGEFDWF